MRQLLRISWSPALVATLAVTVIGAATTPRFFELQNFQNVILQLAVVAILSMGAALVILTAEIDLSPGAMVSLLSMTLATFVARAGIPVAAVVPIVVAAGSFVIALLFLPETKDRDINRI